MSDDTVVGKVGIVTHPIRSGRLGEVCIKIRGGSETYSATANEDIPKNTEVLILSSLSARTVSVTPLEV